MYMKRTIVQVFFIDLFSLIHIMHVNSLINSLDSKKVEAVAKMEDSATKLLDLVFLMDCTGSMGSYIKAGKDNIQTIVDKLSKQENCDVRSIFLYL